MTKTGWKNSRSATVVQQDWELEDLVSDLSFVTKMLQDKEIHPASLSLGSSSMY